VQNWYGYKVMALWKYGEESFDFLDDYLRQMFVQGCGAKHMAQLNDACKVVLVGASGSALSPFGECVLAGMLARALIHACARLCACV
jgi:hypothetical protein